MTSSSRRLGKTLPDWVWVRQGSEWVLESAGGRILARSSEPPTSPAAAAEVERAWELIWTEACHQASHDLRTTSSRYRRPERVSELLDMAARAEVLAFDGRARKRARKVMAEQGVKTPDVARAIVQALRMRSHPASAPQPTAEAL